MLTRALKQVKETFHVRAELDSARVEFFVKILMAGGKLPPLIITKKTGELEDGELIDGRHRKAAYERLGRTQVPVEIDAKVRTREEAIFAAFAANMGGSLPPKERDFTHTVRLLLKSGMSRGRVAKGLHDSTGIALSIFKRYVNDVQSSLAKQRLLQARDAIADRGLTLKEAAEEFAVDAARLRAKLKGGAKTKEIASQLSAFKAGISKRFQAFSAINGKMPAKLRDLHDTGELKPSEIEAILQHFGQKLQALSLQYRNWLVRFEKEGIIKHKKK